jgi:hypothetical protein
MRVARLIHKLHQVNLRQRQQERDQRRGGSKVRVKLWLVPQQHAVPPRSREKVREAAVKKAGRDRSSIKAALDALGAKPTPYGQDVGLSQPSKPVRNCDHFAIGFLASQKKPRRAI